MRNLCFLMAALGLIRIAAAQHVQYYQPYAQPAAAHYMPGQGGYAMHAYPQAGYPAQAYSQGVMHAYPQTGHLVQAYSQGVMHAYPQAGNPVEAYSQGPMQAVYGQPVYSPEVYAQSAPAQYLPAAAPCASGNCGHCCPSHCSRGRCLHRTGMFGEFLYWQVSGADTSYGIVQDGIGPPGTVPLGEVGLLEYDHKASFRTGGTLALNCDSSISVAVTKFETMTDHILAADAPLVIQPLVTFPGTVNAGATAQLAQADSSLELDAVDIEYRAVLYSTSRYFVNLMVGARYTELDQSFAAAFPFAPPDGMTWVATDLDFEGIGPRIGLDGECFLWRHLGISVYSKGTATLLGGEFSGYYAQLNQFNGTEAFTAWEDDRIVPTADLEVGLRWSSPRERIKLSAGYYLGVWGNVVTTAEWIDGVQGFNFVDVANDTHDTLRFDGLVARAEVRL